MKFRADIAIMTSEFDFKFSLCSQKVMFCSAIMPQVTLLRLLHFHITYPWEHNYTYVTYNYMLFQSVGELHIMYAICF